MTSLVLLLQVLSAHAKEPDDEDSFDPIPANEWGWTSAFLLLKSRTISLILMVLRMRLSSMDQSIISDPSSPEMGPATIGIISKHCDVVGGQLGPSASVEPISRSMCNNRVILRGYKLLEPPRLYYLQYRINHDNYVQSAFWSFEARLKNCLPNFGNVSQVY